jgi:hypothetical protein
VNADSACKYQAESAEETDESPHAPMAEAEGPPPAGANGPPDQNLICGAGISAYSIERSAHPSLGRSDMP